MSSIYPAFPLRAPLGRGFPTHASKEARLRSPSSALVGEKDKPLMKPRRTPKHHPGHDAYYGKYDRGVEEEYVRNLQQQIYLLELETRYLRGSGVPRETTEGLPSGTNTAPLNESIKSLKMKFVDLQEKHRKETKDLEERNRELESQKSLQALTISNLEKEVASRQNDLSVLRDTHSEERDKLVADAVRAQKRCEQVQSERDCLKLTCDRLHADRDRLFVSNRDLANSSEKSRSQLDEQIAINSRLNHSVEELRREKILLEAKLEDGEARVLEFNLEEHKATLKEVQDERLKLLSEVKILETFQSQLENSKSQITSECAELVKKNVALASDNEELRRRLKREGDKGEDRIRRRQDYLKEVDSQKADLERLRDEMQTSRASREAKDRKLAELEQKISVLETALAKATDSKIQCEEQIAENTKRLEAQEEELIRITQDKSLLVSDVADLRNNVLMKERRVTALTKDLHIAKTSLDRNKRELSHRQEFDHLVREVAASGESYMSLMRGVRSFIRPGKGEEIEDRGDETNANTSGKIRRDRSRSPARKVVELLDELHGRGEANEQYEKEEAELDLEQQ